MAERKRRENRKSSLEAIEAKIEKAKKKVIETEQAHTDAVKELKNLMDARDAMRRDAIAKLLINSKRSYEEIEAFLKTEPSDQKRTGTR